MFITSASVFFASDIVSGKIYAEYETQKIEKFDVFETINNAPLFTNQEAREVQNFLQDGTKVVVIGADEENEELSFVLTVISEEEITGYIQTANLSPLTEEFEETELKTICKNVDVWSYPSESFDKVSTISAENTTIKVVGTVCGYVDQKGNSYYEVEIDNETCFINQNFLAEPNVFESEKIETEPIQSNTMQFVAFVLSVVALLVITLVVCILISKKYNKKPKTK
jgi:hypothetical protein